MATMMMLVMHDAVDEAGDGDGADGRDDADRVALVPMGADSPMPSSRKSSSSMSKRDTNRKITVKGNASASKLVKQGRPRICKQCVLADTHTFV